MRARVRGAVAAAVLAATLASAVPTSAAPTDVAPFSSIDAFVKQQYRDFTGREPFALELSSSRAPLEAGTSTPAEAVDEISHRDDGSVRIGGQKCKDAPDAAKAFRSITVKP